MIVVTWAAVVIVSVPVVVVTTPSTVKRKRVINLIIMKLCNLKN